MGMTGCARVSTDIQDEASQLELLGAAGCDVFYVDHASGKDMDRPEWQNCLKSLHRGDTLVIVRLDRLGRSLVDLIQTIETLGERGVQLRSLSEAIDTTTPAGGVDVPDRWGICPIRAIPDSSAYSGRHGRRPCTRRTHRPPPRPHHRTSHPRTKNEGHRRTRGPHRASSRRLT